ncbi:inositol polyphosphate kinase family protein [Streptomyces xiamenensis]
MRTHGDHRENAERRRTGRVSVPPADPARTAIMPAPASIGSPPVAVRPLPHPAGNAAVPPPGAGCPTIGPAVERVEDGAVGGHGGISNRAGGRIKEKPTNHVEREFYAELRAGAHPALDGVAPYSHTARQVTAMDGHRGAGDDSTHVYVDNLTFGMNRPTILDLKVGASTASWHELLRSMSKAAALVKKLRMKAADRLTGSARRGYRAVGSSGLTGGRLAIGRRTPRIVRGFCREPGVPEAMLPQLIRVREAARASGLAFVGASVLIAVDEAPPAGRPVPSVKVGLIDFAHTFGPRSAGAKRVEKYRQRFDQGMDRLIADVRAAGAAGRQQPGADAR